jgi:hypothetical protein
MWIGSLQDLSLNPSPKPDMHAMSGGTGKKCELGEQAVRRPVLAWSDPPPPMRVILWNVRPAYISDDVDFQ